MPEHASYQEILDYWYAQPMRQRWFSSTPALDAEIRGKFADTWEMAARGELGEWKTSPDACLALIIVLDQLPLNMYRGQAKSFQTEHQAVDACKYAISRGFDRAIPRDRLAFLFMPLMHSEDLADQELSVHLFEQAGLEDNLRFARHHRDLVRKFGRFPHRNAILGRTSTEEEIEYLRSKEAFLG